MNTNYLRIKKGATMPINENTQSYIVTAENVGERLDKYISIMNEDITRSMVPNLIDNEFVTVNGIIKAKRYAVRLNDEITVTKPELAFVNIEAQDIPIEVLYEDDYLLVVNKPKGMVVHPAAGHPDGTLVNALLYHCGDSLSGINGEIRPGIVHRIDKDTSGLLVIAKNDIAHNHLSKQLSEHSMKRVYQAIAYGRPKENSGVVDAPIGRSTFDRKKMAITDKYSKNAVTNYEVIEQFIGFVHLQLKLETGRTHQIRVHMASLGFPLAGDTIYGPKKAITQLKGQCLHAGLLGFIHPKTNEYMEFTTPIPEVFEIVLNKLKRNENL